MIYPNAVAAFPEVRQSWLAAFDRCELASFFDQTFADYHTHPQGRGSIFHATAAECLRLMVMNDSPVIDVDTAMDVLEEQIRQRDTEPGERLPIPAKQIAELRITVKKWANENSFSIQNIVSIEERMRVTVSYTVAGDVTERILTGALDLLMIDANNHATVIDWKDTWALPGPSEISESGYFQQRFYAMLVFLTYPAVRSVTLREFYPRYGEAREAVLGREKLPDLIAEFSALVERHDAAWEAHLADAQTYEQGGKPAPWVTPRFSPSPGSHCSFCTMPEHCPIMPEARGAGSVTDQQQAETVAAQILVAKAIVKKASDSLKAYVDVHGPVPVKDAKRRREFGFVEVKRKKKPDLEQIEAALAAAESDEDRATLVAGLFTTSVGTSFKDYDATTTDKETA